MSRQGLSTRYLRTGPLNPAFLAREARRERLAARLASLATLDVDRPTTEQLAGRARAAGLDVAVNASGRLVACQPCVPNGHRIAAAIDSEADLARLIDAASVCPTHGTRA